MCFHHYIFRDFKAEHVYSKCIFQVFFQSIFRDFKQKLSLNFSIHAENLQLSVKGLDIYISIVKAICFI